VIKITTYGDCNTTEDDAISANTETLLADLTIPSGKGGRIKKVLVGYGNAVNAKPVSGYVELKLGSHSGPFRYPIGSGIGGATSAAMAQALEVEVDIEVYANETVKLYVTLSDAAVGGFGGIVWVA